MPHSSFAGFCMFSLSLLKMKKKHRIMKVYLANADFLVNIIRVCNSERHDINWRGGRGYNPSAGGSHSHGRSGGGGPDNWSRPERMPRGGRGRPRGGRYRW